MTRFKAKIWKSGTSNVITIPAQIVGLDYKLGDEVIIEIQDLPGVNRTYSYRLADNAVTLGNFGFVDPLGRKAAETS